MAALTTDNAVYDSLKLGVDSVAEGSQTLANLVAGYDIFSSAEDVDISLIMQGKAMHGTYDAGLSKYIIDNICEVRKDCVVFGSPDRADVVGVTNASTAADNIVAFRNSARSSSYGILAVSYTHLTLPTKRIV